MADRVVFTDLDGTLLDARTYSWRPAEAALDRLARLGVPVILTSSKTRVEIEEWRRRLGNGEVFVSENGGGVYFPEACAARAPANAEPWDGYRRIVLGMPYPAVREALVEMRRETGLRLLGFGDMTAEEVELCTGLGRDDAERAREREFDEPFLWDSMDDAVDESRVREAAQARGLRVSRGGRFFHLHGAHDKGACVRVVAAAYGGARTIGLGDSLNDLDLLSAVAQPAVVARPDGSHEREMRRALPRAHFAHGAGPVGFAEVIELWFGGAEGNGGPG